MQLPQGILFGSPKAYTTVAHVFGSLLFGHPDHQYLHTFRFNSKYSFLSFSLG